jgi:hypothetical protein
MSSSSNIPSSASMPHLSTSSMSDYYNNNNQQGYGTPTKSAAAVPLPQTPSHQQHLEGKENIRTPMVSAIPTRLKQQQQYSSNEPSIQELLAQSPGVVHTRSAILHQQADASSSSSSNTGMASWRKGQGFKQWEQELIRSPEVRRKADVAQLCMSIPPSVSSTR